MMQQTRPFPVKLCTSAEEGGSMHGLGGDDIQIFGAQTPLSGIQTDIPTSAVRDTVIRSSRRMTEMLLAKCGGWCMMREMPKVKC